MRVYEYICDVDNHIEEVVVEYGRDLPQEVLCPLCGNRMRRLWRSPTIAIPDYMRAGTGDDHTTWKNKMAHAKRPSGRDKVYY